MSAQHRRPPRFSRRAVLGMSALAALPLAGLVTYRTQRPVASEPAPPSAAPSAVPTSKPPTVVALRGGGPVPYVPGKVLFGAYLDLDGLSPAEAAQRRRAQLGRDERIAHVFYAWPDTLPDAISWLPGDAYPMISWRGAPYRDVLSSGSEALIRRNARQLKRFGRPVLLRWAWEMNGDWYAWGAANNGDDASGFVDSWRRLHRLFADEGADNVSWVWSPNWNDSPDDAWNHKDEYYPGDEYVDWVGVSGYNLHRETPEKLFGALVKSYGSRKPIMITETGAVDRGGSTKADWITLFHQWCLKNPQVGGVVWFDTDTHPGYEERWRADTDPKSLAAYKAMATDPRFSA